MKKPKPLIVLKVGWENALKKQCDGYKNCNVAKRIKELTKMIITGEAIVK